MRQELTKVFRLWLALVAEQLLLFPVACILYQLTQVERFGWFTVSYLALDGLAMLARVLLPKRFRPYLLIVGMLGGVGLSLLYSPDLFFRMAASVLLAIILWHGVRMTEQGNPGAFFSSFLLLGFLLYPLIAFVFSRSPLFAHLLPTLGYTGTAGILLSLILINRQQIRDAGTVLERKLHLPSSLLRRNSVYLAIFTVLVLAAASWELFSRLVTGLFSMVGRVIGAIIAFFAGLNRPEEPPVETGGVQDAVPDMMPPAEPTPRWMEILEQIFIVLVALALSALLLWGLYKLIKRLVPVIKKAFLFLSNWLRTVFLGDDRHMEMDPGFVDEVESLLKQNETALSAARRWLMERIAHEPGYGTMNTDGDRVRWLYRNLLRREMKHGFVFQPGDTPAEILKALMERKRRHQQLDADTASRVYGLVRYGGTEPDPEAVLQMKRACE